MKTRAVLLSLTLVLSALAVPAFAQGTPSTAHFININWWSRQPVGDGFGWGGNADVIGDAIIVERQSFYKAAGTTTWSLATVYTSPNGPNYVNWQSGIQPPTIPRSSAIDILTWVRWYKNGVWYYNFDVDQIPGD